MIVTDASALVELLLRTAKAGRLAAALRDEDAAAPELVDVEVVSALARLVRAGAVADRDADAAVDALRRMPLTRVSHAALTTRAWQLRDRVRVADAYYVACAEFFGCAVLTADARLARAPLPGAAILLVS